MSCTYFTERLLIALILRTDVRFVFTGPLVYNLPHKWSKNVFMFEEAGQCGLRSATFIILYHNVNHTKVERKMAAIHELTIETKLQTRNSVYASI